MAGTITDVFAGTKRRLVAKLRTVLYFAFHCDDVSAVPSRHLLDGIDVIHFGRGPRTTVRSDIGGRPGLTIRVPDPVMSADHGRLVQTDDAWLLEDPGS